MVIYETIFKQHGLSQTQKEIINLVGKNKIILEVGPSVGYMTNIFLNNGCTVDVVESDKEALVKLPKGVRKVLNHSIENTEIKKLLSKDYDYIIMADVLEHLVNPEEVLRILYAVSSKKCELIISLPNVASWVMRRQLFFKGNFEYQESGILDKTHLHFYSVNTLPKLLAESGWQVKKVVGTLTRLPFEGLISKIPIVGFIFRNFLYNKIVQTYPNLSYYHFLVIASKE